MTVYYNNRPRFEAVSRFAEDAEMLIPKRGTAASAGYDFVVAEDIVVPPYLHMMNDWQCLIEKENSFDEPNIELKGIYTPRTLSQMAELTKATKIKPTLVSSGVKCEIPSNMYLELSVRSSTPLKYWLIMANSVGIIDADYYNNPDNEGEIFFQMINLSPFPIQLHKGDKIGQGIFKEYRIAADDNAKGNRTGGFGSTSK